LPILTNCEWVWKLAFLVGITKHVNDFNLKLQGRDVFICDIYTFIKVFRQKLILFETQISTNDFTHIFTCNKYNEESKTQFPILCPKKMSKFKI